MDNKQKSIDLSFLTTFKYLLNFYNPLLLIYGIFLFDSLEIMIYGNGIFSTDFSIFFNLSSIPFFLLFMIIFGVVSTSFSSLVNDLMLKLYPFISLKIEFLLKRLFGFESKPKKTENLININSMYEIALTTENTFLLEYIKKEIKGIHNVKRNHRIIYSLFTAMIINWFVMLLYEKKTILDFIISLYKSNENFLIKICLSLLIIPVVFTILYGLWHSVIFNNECIYFPDSKYKLLVEQKKSLLNKK